MAVMKMEMMTIVRVVSLSEEWACCSHVVVVVAVFAVVVVVVVGMMKMVLEVSTNERTIVEQDNEEFGWWFE